MNMRMQLSVPPMLAKAVDIAFTLAGQSPSYWQGDRADVFEANPLARELLAWHPSAYLAASLLWAAAEVALIVWLPRQLAKVVAFVVTFGHAIGSVTWLVHWFGIAGYLVGAVLLFGAVRLLDWSWNALEGSH